MDTPAKAYDYFAESIFSGEITDDIKELYHRYIEKFGDEPTWFEVLYYEADRERFIADINYCIDNGIDLISFVTNDDPPDVIY